MNKKTKKVSIYEICLIGILAALVFVASNISFPITLPIGETRIHLGNAFCLTAGFVLGGMSGGFAAGIGSAFFDVVNPVYITSAPFTFAFKFLLAFACGVIANPKRSVKLPRKIAAGITGSLLYIALYLGKSFIENLLLGVEPAAATAAILGKLGASCVNAVIAVIVSVPLSNAIMLALRQANIRPRLE